MKRPTQSGLPKYLLKAGCFHFVISLIIANAHSLRTRRCLLMCVSLFVSETCRDVFCPGSSTCVVDQTNNAYCVTCNRICPEPTSSEQYLCGNDGVTYSSACHLRKATCLLGRSIGLAYEGKCISRYSGSRNERENRSTKASSGVRTVGLTNK